MTATDIPDLGGASELRLLVASHATCEGALLPVLQAIQAKFGFIPPDCVPIVAEALNLSKAEVHGVVSFYRDFRRAPAGKPIIKLCRAEACQARGADALAVHAQRDDRIALETVYCLGLCASGPAAMIDDRVVARLDPSRFDRLVDEATQ